MSMELVGITQLLASLEMYRVRKTAEILEAVHSAAQDALGMAIELCPVSPDGSHGNPPGVLRAGNAIRQVAELATIAQWELYNQVPYCGYVVLGTYKMKAQDFMTPAFDYGRAQLIARMEAIGVGL